MSWPASRGDADVTLFATGSEVEIALAAKKQIEAAGRHARVVSVPCFELFAEQSEDYQAEIIGTAPVRVAIEAAMRRAGTASSAPTASSSAWTASAPRRPTRSSTQKFGITAEAAAKAALDRLAALA